MTHPLMIVGLETSVMDGTMSDVLVVSSPLGALYKLRLHASTAKSFKTMLATEAKLAVVACERCDDEDDQPRPPQRFSAN